jgi:hypothetical protein
MRRTHMTIAIPSHVSDRALIAEVTRCARDERHATVLLLAHLAELDLRRLDLGAGHPSLFAYCRDGHGAVERSENYAVSWDFSPVPERGQRHHCAAPPAKTG